MNQGDLTGDEEHDMYIVQLKDVFEGCDTTGTKKLGRAELFALCEKLQLQDQSEYLVNELLTDTDEVEFDYFKEPFINILSKSDITVQSSDDEEGKQSDNRDLDPSQDGNDRDQSCVQTVEKEENTRDDSGDSDSSIKQEVSPKYVVGKKRYGRRSMPIEPEDFESIADEDDVEVASSTKSLKHSLVIRDLSDTEEDGSETQRKRRRKEGVLSDDETFEAEGQIDHMMAESGKLTEEEEYLRGIWNNLGVGQNGFISIEELGKVCSYIGMEEMNQTHLQQLFDKLDADGDGRVSFEEFLNELFQHNAPSYTGVSAPKPVRATPTRASSAQRKFKYPNGDDRTTPSIVQGSEVAGIFSVLDPERTGFATVDDIIDLWEKHSVPNGADILIGLGFDLGSKVKLSELTFRLEQELISLDEDNLVYQAAVASFQQEVKHLKSSLEQASWAKEKLRLDLAESNARNSLLAKEVDERHASIENSSMSQLLSVEKKYQEQVKHLQSELDKEREHFANFAAKHKENTETEMEELKEEEGRLREQLVQSQKELEKVNLDLEDITTQLDESSKQNQRLQRELENVHDLHRKLAEYESKSLMSPGEQKFAQEKLQQLEQNNKDLKDQNDELTAEIEHLKQQTVPYPKILGNQEQEVDENDEHTPIRKDGSFLSQYIKPVVLKKMTYISPECSDDETSRHGSAQGRRLPTAPYGEESIRVRLLKSALRSPTGPGFTDQKETIDRLEKEMADLKDQFEIEKKEIEQAYKLEIAGIEEKHDKDKELLMKHLENEKEKIAQEFERLQQAALAELAQDLQNTFVHEKEDLRQKHITERNHSEQLHADEKNKLVEKMKREHAEDIKSQMEEFKVKHEQEKEQLEEALAETEPFIKKLENQNLHLEQKMKKQSEEHEKALKQQKSEMEELLTRHMQKLEDVEKEKQELKLKIKKDLNDHELQYKQDKLDNEHEIGKLNQDLKELKQQHARMELAMKQQHEELEIAFRQEKQELKDLYEEKITELEERTCDVEKKNELILEKGVSSLTGKLKQDFDRMLKDATELEVERSKAELMASFKQQEKELELNFDTRQSELGHLFEREKTEIVEKYEEQIDLLRQELKALQERMEEERESLGQRFEAEKDRIEEVLAQQIREEIEFYKWRKLIRLSHSNVRQNKEEEISQQMEEIRDAYDEEKQEYDAQINLLNEEIQELHRELEREEKNRKKIDDLSKANKMLQQEKRKAEKGLAELTVTLEDTKKALEARIDELIDEKEGAIHAVKAEFVETSRQSGKDKALYDAVVLEKAGLEQQLTDLKNENLGLKDKANKVDELEKQIKSLDQEKNTLKRDQSIPEHAQRAINELTQEKSELEERLVDTKHKLAEVSDMADKYTLLQFDFGQMSIGQNALEETLLDTQERLADMEAKFNQSERELKDAQRYKDKYKLLQRKYEDVSKERDKVSTLAKNLKEQLTQANAASKEEHNEKGNLTKVLEEKKQLEQQLQTVSDKLLEATSNFAVSQSQHIRQLQQWKDQANNMVDLEKYMKLQIDLVDNQRSLRDMQQSVTSKDELSNNLLKENEEKHKETVNSLESQKESLVQQLQTLQKVLDGQIDKFKEQFEKGEQRNALVVDLYKENADLMDALYKVEGQKKEAVSRCYKLEDQCNHLRRMLKKMAVIAVKK